LDGSSWLTSSVTTWKSGDVASTTTLVLSKTLGILPTSPAALITGMPTRMSSARPLSISILLEPVSELALDQIGRTVDSVVTFGGAHPDPATPAALDTQVVHQPLDGATGDTDTVFVVEVMPDLVGPVDDQVLFPHPQDLGLQFRIPLCSC